MKLCGCVVVMIYDGVVRVSRSVACAPQPDLLDASWWWACAVAFDVYDLNGDERIDKSELRKLLDAALTENSVPLSEAQVTELVETTFAQADTNKDGFIDRDEFRAMVNRHRAIIDHIELNVTDIIKEAKAAASSSEGSGAGAGAGAGSRGK